MKTILTMLAAVTVGALAGCSRPGDAEDIRESTEAGLQPGEVYDTGGSSLTNPVETIVTPQPIATNTGPGSGVIRAP